MANVCNYEIHIKGSKKAALYFVDMMPSYCRDKEIIHEEGTDNEYIVWMIGDCKWGLDAYCEENPDAAAEVADDLERLTEEDIRNMDTGNYWDLPMQQKSEVLGVEVLAHSWSRDSEFDKFDHYLNGELVSSALCPLYWDKGVFDTYEAFCETFNIDPNRLPESSWLPDEVVEEDEDVEDEWRSQLDPEKIPFAF